MTRNSPPAVPHLRFRPRKAFAALRWMLAEAQRDGRGPADLHTLLKACYFADKQHLNRNRRPILGATYRAMPYGPVPLEVYEMAKGEPLWLQDLGLPDYPWRREGFRIIPTSDAAVDLSDLSPSELAALREGFRRARGLTFNERTAESHDEAWHRARHGVMDYADMVDADNPARVDILEALAEDGHLWAP